jgi:hypothetical protein
VKLWLKRSRSGFEPYGFSRTFQILNLFCRCSPEITDLFRSSFVDVLKKKLRSFTCLPVILFGDWKEKTKENFLNLL